MSRSRSGAGAHPRDPCCSVHHMAHTIIFSKLCSSLQVPNESGSYMAGARTASCICCSESVSVLARPSPVDEHISTTPAGRRRSYILLPHLLPCSMLHPTHTIPTALQYSDDMKKSTCERAGASKNGATEYLISLLPFVSFQLSSYQPFLHHHLHDRHHQMRCCCYPGRFAAAPCPTHLSVPFSWLAERLS